jgi:hypothetical protein
MKEATTASPYLFVNLSKDALLKALTEAYATSQPINEKLVDISLHIAGITAEIYRRSIVKQSGLPVSRVRTVMKISLNVHPNKGLQLVAQRLAQLKDQGIEITAVTYDENTSEFSFYTKPEFQITDEAPTEKV